MWDYFGVRLGDKGMPELLEFRSQLSIVVDLTIEHNPDRPILVTEWLLSSDQIGDGQSPMTERALTLNHEALVVAAAMSDRIGHCGDLGSSILGVRPPVNDAADAAHQHCPRRPVTRLRRSRYMRRAMN